VPLGLVDGPFVLRIEQSVSRRCMSILLTCCSRRRRRQRSLSHTHIHKRITHTQKKPCSTLPLVVRAITIESKHTRLLTFVILRGADARTEGDLGNNDAIPIKEAGGEHLDATMAAEEISNDALVIDGSRCMTAKR